MKHIIDYKLFESANSNIIGDILLDITDEGYKHSIRYDGYSTRYPHSSTNTDILIIIYGKEIDRDVLSGYKERQSISQPGMKIIMPCIERLSEYMSSEGYHLSKTDKERTEISFRYKFSSLSLMRAKSKYKI